MAHAAWSKKIYLTFDDGPVPGPTEFVLEELASRNFKATFFCIGDNVKKHQNIFERVKSAGHRVANHTFHHSNGWKTDITTYEQDVEDCRNVMKADNLLFRPPYGRIKRNQIKVLSTYRIVMWDVLSYDFANLSAERCLKGSLGAVRDGSIIVFHDSVKAEKNLRFILPRFLDQIEERGYIPSLIPANT